MRQLVTELPHTVCFLIDKNCRKDVFYMEGKEKKSGFSSKIGFVLAAAGSAVGLGNLWRFPYLAAQYGGGIFLLVYLLLAVTFGFALMVTEIALGRKTGKSVIGAFSELHPKFSALGWVAAAVPLIIFPYYCVIGGWVIKYLWVYLVGQGASAADDGTYFSGFIGNLGPSAFFMFLFMAITALVVMLGVEKGIEKVSKIMMPILLLISVVIAGYVLTIDGAMAGLIYYIKPDFGNFSIKTLIAAMGQLFYSMSLAMGILFTYGSYMRKEDDLESSVRHIELFDTGVAFLAGLMIIPAVFAFSGGDESALGTGPSLMFITLPNVFESMAQGRLIGIIFFILVMLAALTSSISLMETLVSVLCERTKMKRIPACLVVFAVSMGLAMLSVLGYSSWSHVTIMGRQILDFFDFISNNVIMPLVALATCVLVAYVLGTKTVEEEVEQQNHTFKAKKLYRIVVRYIAPVILLMIFVSSLLGGV